MEPGEALSTAAQIAVTLAGFAGVVVVFRRESVHDWTPIDKFRLRLLLANSILPLALCVIGLLLLTIRPAPAGIWRWCSGSAVVILLPFAITTSGSFRRLDRQQLQSALVTDSPFIYSAYWELAQCCSSSSTSQYLMHSGRFSPASSCTC
jgi:hypothetical protein